MGSDIVALAYVLISLMLHTPALDLSLHFDGPKLICPAEQHRECFCPACGTCTQYYCSMKCTHTQLDLKTQCNSSRPRIQLLPSGQRASPVPSPRPGHLRNRRAARLGFRLIYRVAVLRGNLALDRPRRPATSPAEFPPRNQAPFRPSPSSPHLR